MYFENHFAWMIWSSFNTSFFWAVSFLETLKVYSENQFTRKIQTSFNTSFLERSHHMQYLYFLNSTWEILSLDLLWLEQCPCSSPPRLLSLEVLAGRLGANGGPSGWSFAFGRFEGPRSGGRGKLHGRALLLKPHADGHQLFCCWLWTQDKDSTAT